ncbi:MAG: aminotransferase class I/II-fold pyridoxal phosphate-dependent enzyme [Candidatus Latescibacterota bacterium]|nr:MAG: aminotransferase class I/II-fold pyridoxal phosphate-dependent enzyme [Candidatus Latescibacterota bacterium]
MEPAKESSLPAPESRQPDPTLDYDYSNFFWGTGNDVFDIFEPFEEWYKAARPAGYYLFGLPMNTGPGARVDIVETKTNKELKNLINLASYNYLGLSHRPEVIEAAVKATERYGTGASGSPILSGTISLHDELAARVARFKRKEQALLFPSGYSANLGVISGLMRSGDLIVTDQYAHASIMDGIVLSKANVRYFRHNSIGDLHRKLKGFKGKKLVIVEGVYSMDGDLAKLPEIVEVSRRHKARIMIDEAHSTFLFGKNGRGVAEHFGLENEVDIHFGTFSKTLGGIGGFVAGSKTLVTYLKGFSRSRVFSCALPPGVAAGLIKALDIVESEPELRTRLWENVDFMQGLLRKAGVDIGDSSSQVIPIMVRDDDRIFKIAEDMIHEGVYLNPVRYPAVGKHRSRFRISITAGHSKEDLAEGADIIQRVLERYGLCR